MKHIKIFIIVAIVSYTIFFYFFSLIRYISYNIISLPTGFFDQCMWTTAYAGKLFYNNMYNISMFGLYFTPILYLIMPFYILHPSPVTLLTIQSFFISIGAVPIYLMVKNRLKSEEAGFILFLAYLLHPSIHWLSTTFFVDILSIPLALFAFHYMTKRAYKLSFLFIALVLACIEYMLLTIISIGLYGIVHNIKLGQFKLSSKKLSIHLKIIDKKLLYFALFTIFFGISWFLFVTKLIVPNFGPGLAFFSSRLPKELLNPLFVIKYITTPEKFQYLACLFAPLSFTPIASPIALLVFSPVFLRNLISTEPVMWDFRMHHTASPIPFVFIAAILGIEKIAKHNKRIVAYILITILFVSLISSYYLSPLGKNFQIPEVKPYHKTIDEAIKLIPNDAGVATQDDIWPHVNHRLNAYMGFHPSLKYVLPKIDYVLICNKSYWYTHGSGEFKKNVEMLVKRGILKPVFEKDGVILYKKVS